MICPSEDLVGRKIALFGLSANPPTGLRGHTGVVRFLVETELFDEVWVLPVYQHMFSSKSSMEPFYHRVAMCHLCMDGESKPQCKVRVMEVEKLAAEHYEKKEGPSYRVGTVDILDYIDEKCPGLRLHLVLGTDTYRDLLTRKWKHADRILSRVTVHAISRPGVEITAAGVAAEADSCIVSVDASGLTGGVADNERTGVNVVHHRVPWLAEVSSSLARHLSSSPAASAATEALFPNSTPISEDGAQSDEPDRAPALRDLLDGRVLAYMKEHGLYGHCLPEAYIPEIQQVSSPTDESTPKHPGL